MKKTDKVSVADFEKVYKECESAKVVDWHGVEVTITRTLSLQSMLEFVTSVADSCFADDGDYLPEVKEFAICRNVLERYANFRMPQDVSKCYELICGTDAVEVVLNHVNFKQYNTILDAIDEKIQFRLDTMTDKLHAQIDEMMHALGDLQEQTKHVFDDISEEDMQKMVAAIENGGLNEEKIVAAYLGQKKAPEEAAAD